MIPGAAATTADAQIVAPNAAALRTYAHADRHLASGERAAAPTRLEHAMATGLVSASGIPVLVPDRRFDASITVGQCRTRWNRNG
jgi:hypothetical protein